MIFRQKIYFFISKCLRLFILSIVLFAYNIQAQNKIVFTEAEIKWLEEHPTIFFGYDPNWPPFEIYNNDTYSGIIAEYVKVIERETGVIMKPIPLESYHEAVTKLKQGEINVIPEIGKNKEREQYLKFTEPYLRDPQVIVTRYDFGFISGLSDLTGKTVSQPLGFSRIKRLQEINPKIKIITSKDVKESLYNVSIGKADAYVGSLSVVSYYINNSGYVNLKIASSSELNDIKFRLAVTNDWVLFRDISQKVFSSITKQEHNEIRNKWVKIRYDHGIDKRDVLKYILYGVILIMIIIMSFLYWNKKLSVEIKERKQIEKELRKTLKIINENSIEKDVLLKEVHHRVKNNLQMIYSLFNMQSKEVKNEYAQEVLFKGKARIKTISLVHQLLYQSDNFSKINIYDYFDTLKKNVLTICNDDKKQILIELNVQNVQLKIEQAIPLGLILNELLTNSFKHAFTDKDAGVILITLQEKNNGFYFEYKDNGVGMQNTNFSDHKTLGMRLISRLTNQLNSEPILKNENGIMFCFNFK